MLNAALEAIMEIFKWINIMFLSGLEQLPKTTTIMLVALIFIGICIKTMKLHN